MRTSSPNTLPCLSRYGRKPSQRHGSRLAQQEIAIRTIATTGGSVYLGNRPQWPVSRMSETNHSHIAQGVFAGIADRAVARAGQATGGMLF